MFVQISECQAPLHKCTVKLPYRRLSGDGSVATPSFSLAIFWQQWLDFNTIHEFTFKLYLLTTHCCTLSKPNYIEMLFYKPKQHSKQYTGLKFVIYIEMTD